MNARDIITSRSMKVLVVVLCIGALKFRHVIADGTTGSDAPWFKQNLTLDDVKAAINNKPQQIDEVNADGFTGLMYAVNLGYKEIAEEFIKRGASLDITAKNAITAKDNERFYRSTALHIALLNSDDNKNFEIAKYLINGVKRDDGSMSQKSNVLVKNGFGFTPLHTVESSVENPDRRYELIVMLMDAAGNEEIQQGYLNEQNDEGNTILHIMAQKNDMTLIGKLIEKYGRMLRLDEKNQRGKTAAELSRDSGYGTACATRLDAELKRYNDKSISEDDYKNKPKFNDIPAA